MGSIINDRETILRFIQRAIVETEELQEKLVYRKKGSVLFSQGDPLEYLYLLLDGSAELMHKREDGTSLKLIDLIPGHFIGLLSFATGNTSLTTCTTTDDIKALRVNQSEFEQYVNDHPRLRHPFQQLMISNMTDRFLKNVQLESEMNALNLRLERESNELAEAYKQLESSQQKIIHQEKMSILGELVAGLAHEINNPASSLIRSSEALKEILVKKDINSVKHDAFKFGLESEPVSSIYLRSKMEKLARQFPLITDRAKLRKLAQMQDEVVSILANLENEEEINEIITKFETGKLVNNIHLASIRVAKLVSSLKNYSRQDKSEFAEIDVREGIKDTIHILSHRLKFLNIELDLQDIPETCAKLADLNQVWTNLLVNACDILPENGCIEISCRADKKSIYVEISDNGPGIPEKILEKIFDPNFTTKNTHTNFGLGLGLSISDQIIKQHDGLIKASNKKEGGASFTVTIPIKEC